MTSSANAITYTNAKVFTGSGPEDFVSAFTIEDGVFTWTGESEDVTATDAVDLGGATVLPGLLDVHTHPIFMATLADSMTLLQPEVTSLESMLDALRRHPDLGAGPQAWVMGFGYNEAKYPDGAPDRHARDRVSTEQPVFARRADGHTAVCNTFALDLAGITRDTPDPAGGRIVRDASGEPTGVLEETSAVDLVYRVKPAPDSAEIARRLAGLSEHFLEFGLVAVDDLYGNFVDEPLAVTRAAVDQGSGRSPRSSSSGATTRCPPSPTPTAPARPAWGESRCSWTGPSATAPPGSNAPTPAPRTTGSSRSPTGSCAAPRTGRGRTACRWPCTSWATAGSTT